MSAFTKAVIAYTNLGGIRYRLDNEINWAIGCPSGPVYTVPAGFEFDVSIPRFLWWLFNPHRAQFFEAAAIHDHMLLAGWDGLTAGANFEEALRAEGVGLFTRMVMWIAVSLWCYSYYN